MSRQPQLGTATPCEQPLRHLQLGTPDDPALGCVWTALTAQVDDLGSRSEFVEALDLPRSKFHSHPWAIAAGDESAISQRIESASSHRLAGVAAAIGFQQDTHADSAFVQPTALFARLGVTDGVRAHVRGEDVRDWAAPANESIVFPFDDELREWSAVPRETRWGWFHALRATLSQRAAFAGGTYQDNGIAWYAYHQFPRDRARTPLTITFSEVATHNHFVLDRGGVVFNRTAPVIKLPVGTDEATHLGLLGLLNSSTACFWLQQVCHNKGGPGGGSSKDEKWHDFFQFNGTKVGAFPVPAERPADLAAALDTLARERQVNFPSSVVARATPTRAELDAARVRSFRCFANMIALQEELDWRCYRIYGLTDDEITLHESAGIPIGPPPVELGERAFEIVLARKVEAGEVETKWFDWLGARPTTRVPDHWPPEYRDLVERRVALIESSDNLRLIERVDCKRRWEQPRWEDLEHAALDAWLLDRLESPAYWPAIALQTTRDLAERAALDPEFVQVAALRFGEGVALEPVIRQLASGEAVPFLPALRYTESGREKRAVWEQVWEKQRHEDTVDAAVAAEPAFASPREGESHEAFAKRLAAAQKARREAEVGPIPKPPKYKSTDFQRAEFWRMRGALDVPKERFITYPHCGREGDDAPLLGWAGWTHLQQAEALTTWYTERMEGDGWQGERVVPLLAGMAELLPWLRQWHNDYDAAFGDRPGDAYTAWLEGELQRHGLTVATLAAWEPPRTARRGGRRGTRRAATGEA